MEIKTMLNNLTNWAKKVGLDKSTPEKQMVKLMEEVGELAHALNRNDKNLINDAAGDIVGALNTLCLQLGVSLADCIKQCHDEVTKRKGKMVNGIFIKEEELK